MPSDPKGKGKQKEVTTAEESVQLDPVESKVEVDEHSPPPKRTIPQRPQSEGEVESFKGANGNV